ncbi:hypothetical protein EJ08DRAFT_691738 [Tothia fuscella]|uniref:Uncharacterized protein n=1 Tax=Tothia fuscella TaxID=1048955 RepID=A0A9P4P3C5_9PEZI|nr:hypothetical protein EJ08DRAFT_691738 [Tothia fuscella]
MPWRENAFPPSVNLVPNPQPDEEYIPEQDTRRYGQYDEWVYERYRPLGSPYLYRGRRWVPEGEGENGRDEEQKDDSSDEDADRPIFSNDDEGSEFADDDEEEQSSNAPPFEVLQESGFINHEIPIRSPSFPPLSTISEFKQERK